ncbi:hypothetical protein AYO38_00690 [bacterium SCGC AG-212-C10]|nr:hypothetical protein AYO38_00690 [bacterium SCGC AG-212-C10]
MEEEQSGEHEAPEQQQTPQAEPAVRTNPFSAGAAVLGSAAGAVASAVPAVAGRLESGIASRLRSTKFVVEIDGQKVDGIQSIDELVTQSDATAFKDGGSGHTQFLPGTLHPGKIVLTRRFDFESPFLPWRATVLAGDAERKPMSITFQTERGDESGRINLGGCWPSAWWGPSPGSGSSGLIERIELVWDTIQLVPA